MLNKVIEYVDQANDSTTLTDTSTQVDASRFNDVDQIADWAKMCIRDRGRYVHLSQHQLCRLQRHLLLSLIHIFWPSRSWDSSWGGRTPWWR